MSQKNGASTIQLLSDIRLGNGADANPFDDPPDTYGLGFQIRHLADDVADIDYGLPYDIQLPPRSAFVDFLTLEFFYDGAADELGPWPFTRLQLFVGDAKVFDVPDWYVAMRAFRPALVRRYADRFMLTFQFNQARAVFPTCSGAVVRVHTNGAIPDRLGRIHATVPMVETVPISGTPLTFDSVQTFVVPCYSMPGATVDPSSRVVVKLPFRYCFRYLLLALRRSDQPMQTAYAELIDRVVLTSVSADGIATTLLDADGARLRLWARYNKGFFNNETLAVPMGIDADTSSSKCGGIHRLELGLDLVPQAQPQLLLDLLVAAVGTVACVPSGLTLYTTTPPIELFS